MRKWQKLAPAGAKVWYDLSGMVPTRSGSYYTNGLFTTLVLTGPASPGTTLRAWCALLNTDGVVAYVGTTTKLFQFTGAFTDLSRGGGYTNTATDWTFAQFGNRTLAANKVDATQSRDAGGAGAFGDLAGAPKARILVTQALQILAFDIDDGTDQPDAWAACAPGDYTDWSGPGATTATKILHRPGKITAAIAFRDYVLAFKQSSVYKLTYTGGTFKWRVECIAIGRGAWGKHDVVSCGDCVIFSGPGGAWKFDGSNFTAITDWVGEIPSANGSFFSPLSQNVHFYEIGINDHIYNLVSDAWGLGVQNFGGGASTGYVPMTGEPAALRAAVGPTANLPDLHWLLALDGVAVLVNSVYWGNTISGNCYLASGIEGVGGDQVTYFDELIPNYTSSLRGLSSSPYADPTELWMTVVTGNTKDDYNLDINNSGATRAITNRSSVTAARKFGVNVSAPYARVVITIKPSAGYVEIDDYRLTLKADGFVVGG